MYTRYYIIIYIELTGQKDNNKIKNINFKYIMEKYFGKILKIIKLFKW